MFLTLTGLPLLVVLVGSLVVSAAPVWLAARIVGAATAGVPPRVMGMSICFSTPTGIASVTGASPSRRRAGAPQTRHSQRAGTSASAENGTVVVWPRGQS